MQFEESSSADFTINNLQNERAKLKDKLKSLEATQEEHLRNIVEILGWILILILCWRRLKDLRNF